MSNATYQTLPGLIATLTPYRHGSSHAEFEQVDGERVYAVYSYRTRIAVAQYQPDGELITGLDSRKYSMTTSRLQNIIRRAWAI